MTWMTVWRVAIPAAWPTGRHAQLSLREALSRVRQGIAAELAFDQNASEGEELESLVEIERAVEEIIRSSALINQALRGRREPRIASDRVEQAEKHGCSPGYFSSRVNHGIP